MTNNDTEEEQSFRERYAQELQKKKNSQALVAILKMMRCLKKEETWVSSKEKHQDVEENK